MRKQTQPFIGESEIAYTQRMDELNEQIKQANGRTFRVDGFGVVGEANLLWFVPNKGEKPWQDLAVGESCFGVAKSKPEHITRES